MIANLNKRDIKFPVANTYRLLSSGLLGKRDVATLTDFVELKDVSLANAKRIGQLTDIHVHVGDNWIYCHNSDPAAIEKCYEDVVVVITNAEHEDPIVVEPIKEEEFVKEPEVETYSNNSEPIEIEANPIDPDEPITTGIIGAEPVEEEKPAEMNTNQPIKLNKKHKQH